MGNKTISKTLMTKISHISWGVTTKGGYNKDFYGITLHQGKSSKTISYESEIFDYVYYNRALGNAVTSNEIIFKLWSIDEKYGEKSWISLQKWWYRFMKRHFLTFRRNTHISQKLLEKYLDKILEFVFYNIKLRSKYWFELDAIANMDETPLYLNIPPSTTVQKIGSKRVNIKTQGQENWRVTAILTILASGENLP